MKHTWFLHLHPPRCSLVADAVVDVRAVVVKALDAAVANVAVPAAERANHLAVRTQNQRICLLEQRQEVDLGTRLEVARVLVRREQEEKQHEDCERAD